MSENAERDADQARETEETGSAAQAAAEQTTDGAEAGTGTANSVGTDPLDELRRQLNDQREKYLRLAAEFDNFRKRVTRERTELGERAQAGLVTRLLDVLDDMDRLGADGGAASPESIRQAVGLVDKKLRKELEAAGLERIDPAGQPFDPSLHEAVSTLPPPSPDRDHTVSATFQTGYRFKGTLIRPARVQVYSEQGQA